MDLRAIIMGLAFAFMWSSAFTSARIIVAHAPPVTALGLRFLISGLLAIAIAAALGQSFRLTRLQLWATIVFGICQNALYLGLNFAAMQTVEASVASIIASTMPLIVAFAGWAVLGERVTPLGLIGLAAGTMGVLIIMGSRVQAGLDLTGVAMCAGGVIALSVATMTMRGASSGGNLLMVVGYQMLVGSAILSVIGLTTEDVTFTPAWSLLGAFAYTTVFPGLIATWVWFELVRRIGAVRAATFHFLNPFFGVAVAAALLGERLGVWDIIGVAVIMVGILAVQLSKQRRST